MVQIYIYVFSKIADLGSLCKMEHFVSKLGRLLLFEGISCTCYFTTGFPTKWVSQLVYIKSRTLFHFPVFFQCHSVRILEVNCKYFRSDRYVIWGDWDLQKYYIEVTYLIVSHITFLPLATFIAEILYRSNLPNCVTHHISPPGHLCYFKGKC